MTKNLELQRYVDAVGGRAVAAERLSVSQSHLSLMVNRKRGMSPQLARRIVNDSPVRIDVELLLWGDSSSSLHGDSLG